MSQSAPLTNGPAAARVQPIESAELLVLRDDLAALRMRVVTAWMERGVMLTSPERARLRDEVRGTCTFLLELTQADD